MSSRDWENVEVVETFDDANLQPLFDLQADSHEFGPQQADSYQADDSLPSASADGGFGSSGFGSSGPRWRSALGAALIATAVASGLLGYVVGHHNGTTSGGGAAAVGAITASPSTSTEQADPPGGNWNLQNGPCDLLASTTSQLDAANPVIAVLNKHFPTFSITELLTSRYDANDRICSTAVKASNGMVSADITIDYFGVSQDTTTTMTNTYLSQVSQSYMSSFTGRYQVQITMTTIDVTQLPRIEALIAFANDQALALTP